MTGVTRLKEGRRGGVGDEAVYWDERMKNNKDEENGKRSGMQRWRGLVDGHGSKRPGREQEWGKNGELPHVRSRLICRTCMWMIIVGAPCVTVDERR